MKLDLENLEVEGSKCSTVQRPSVRPARPLPVPSDNGRSKTSVVVVRGLPELLKHLEDWEDLAEHALEPNVFYEPWALASAVKSFAADQDLRFLLIFGADSARPTGPPLLCGLFPLELKKQCVGLPVSTLTLWKHVHCFLCTPLIRASHAKEILAAFFDYLESKESGCSLMEFNSIPGEGRFRQLLADLIYERSMPVFEIESYTRAVIHPAQNAKAYIDATISGRHRKELRRKENRLSEQGQLTYTALERDGDVEGWIRDFLNLEASGWKGAEQSALAAKESERSFFQAVAREAFLRDRLMMLAIHLDDQPIALKCNWLTHDAAFAFKIAYDERYAEFSPGVLLELENIRRIHASQTIRWMDSCAAPNHPMINRLWTERRIIQTLVMPARRGSAEFLVSTMPLLRWAKRKLSLGKPPDQKS